MNTIGIVASTDHKIGSVKSATRPSMMKNAQNIFFSMSAFYSPAFLSQGKRIKREA
jgi:hypothetical protein